MHWFNPPPITLLDIVKTTVIGVWFAVALGLTFHAALWLVGSPIAFFFVK